jgi:hypothetical protein
MNTTQMTALPYRTAPEDPVVWNVDHIAAQMGLLSGGFVRANFSALIRTIEASGAGVVVDFWNPFV